MWCMAACSNKRKRINSMTACFSQLQSPQIYCFVDAEALLRCRSGSSPTVTRSYLTLVVLILLPA